MKNIDCQTYTTVSQSKPWAFTSTSIQTERSDEGVKTEQKTPYYF